jgi:uncharacterized membrane protein YccF (DUF307 family)
MRTIGNFIWFVFGGVLMGLAWWLYGILAFITIVGIPFGIQHLKLAGISLFPIGKTIVKKEMAWEAYSK